MLFFRKITQNTENVAKKWHNYSSTRGAYYYTGPVCVGCGAKATDRDIYGAPTFTFKKGTGTYAVVHKCATCIPASDFMEGRDPEPAPPEVDPAEERAAQIAVRKARAKVIAFPRPRLAQR